VHKLAAFVLQIKDMFCIQGSKSILKGIKKKNLMLPFEILPPMNLYIPLFIFMAKSYYILRWK
jgi:hypothetical protein